MGESYEVKELGGVWYLEYPVNDSYVIVELTEEQQDKISDFSIQQEVDRQNFLKNLVS